MGVAHARPGFGVAETQARAGDVVHFSITGARGRVSYELDVGGREVLESSGSGSVVSGSFTVADFGASAKTLEVEAEIRDSDGTTTVKRTLQYLGQVVVAPTPPTPPPVAQQAPAPPPSQAPATAGTPAAPAPAVRHRPKSKPRRVSKRRKAKRHREVSRRSRPPAAKQKDAPPVTKKKPAGRPPARTAPLFDGVPERGSSRYSNRNDDGSVAPGAKKKPTEVLLGTAVRGDQPGDATAILVPGLIAMAGFVLAGATLLRRRRNR